MQSEHPLVLFDGVCNLCESTVRFIIKRDRNATFRFASLQSQQARDLLRDIGYAGEELESVLLISENRVYAKSRAGLEIARRLDGAWPLLFYLFFWVPRFIGDPIYEFIGKRRYRWFGQKEECWVPTPDLARRFIDMPDNSGD